MERQSAAPLLLRNALCVQPGGATGSNRALCTTCKWLASRSRIRDVAAECRDPSPRCSARHFSNIRAMPYWCRACLRWVSVVGQEINLDMPTVQLQIDSNVGSPPRATAIQVADRLFL